MNTPLVRSDFRDTAYWSGKLVTDANGAAEMVVHLPDNLTTWVVTARGLSSDLRVGEGTRELVVSKDLLIRPVTPRFLVVGDRILLGATVNNNTQKAISADVSLQASGLELETPAQASQKVDLPAQGRARVSWWARVQDVEKADLLFSVKGGGLEDASRAADGSLPVEKYAVPQTFGTGGLLAEAGERLEVVSAPRSFNATGGELRVELSPSLAASILSGLKALENFPRDFTEPVLSRLLANLETYQALQKLGVDSPDLRSQLESIIQQSMSRLVSWQNKDGGWGWSSDQDSDPYLSAYVLFGLSEAVRAGVQVDAAVVKKAGDYIVSVLITPAANTSADRLDRLAFQHFSLQQAGRGQKTSAGLYEYREKLSPWARALLALTLNAQNANDPQARNLVSDLQAQALRSATGAHWETQAGAQLNLSTPVFTTALVSLALAQLDPAAAVLTDAVRYLSAHRRANGSWASSYESAWVLMALTEVMRGTGELSASFAYSGELNGSPIASGQAGGPGTLTPVESRIPLSQLRQDSPNGLKIIHNEGVGRLYYRAYLTVNRPVEQVAPLDRGLTVSRQIYLAGQDCTKTTCQPVSSVRLSDQRELFVRLTLTLPQSMYHLTVEDFIPAGTEIVDTSLKTVPQAGQGYPGEALPLYGSADPFGSGWNWWLFGAPKLYDDHIRWTAPYLAAGTYVLTYRLTPLQSGEFRLLPAHAYETYFPEVEGASAGAIFRIDP